MRTKYSYYVTVLIKSRSSKKALYDGESAYLGGNGRTDQVRIWAHQIVIECERTSRLDLDGIFSNYQSSLYLQISKAVAYYICVKNIVPVITSLKVAAYRSGEKIGEKVIGSNDFIERGKMPTKFLVNFEPKKLKVLFDDSDKAVTLLKAISHLIRAKTKLDIFDRFEGLWKSYNALYRTIAPSSTEHDSLVGLRNFILSQPEASRSVVGKVSKLNSIQLRERLRWRALILNDFDTPKKTKAFKDFIERYTDSRLMEIFNSVLPYRSDYLQREGLLEKTREYIKAQFEHGGKNDRELVALICIKYMYFVRNKSVHGERIDRLIGLDGKENREILWLGELLEAQVIDLINANDLYPD